MLLFSEYPDKSHNFTPYSYHIWFLTIPPHLQLISSTTTTPKCTLAPWRLVTFYNDAKPPPKWIWCITNPTPARRVTPPWNVYVAKFDSGWEGYPVWQTGLAALASHPTYHVNVIRLKWEDIWNGGVPHLSRLLHLPGAPPSPMQTKKLTCLLLCLLCIFKFQTLTC